jgi:uncharacterized protein YbaR (Trm112 family)
MLDAALLKILCCPDTRQPLRWATADQVAALNAQIAAGTRRNAGGVLVTEPVEGALIREDSQVLYPVRDGIPALLPEEGMPLT